MHKKNVWGQAITYKSKIIYWFNDLANKLLQKKNKKNQAILPKRFKNGEKFANITTVRKVGNIWFYLFSLFSLYFGPRAIQNTPTFYF